MISFNVTYSYNAFVGHLYLARGSSQCGSLPFTNLLPGLCFFITWKYSRRDELSHISQPCYKPLFDSSQKSSILKWSNPFLSGAEQAVMLSVKRRMSLMATSVRMCESDKVFVFYSTVYVHVNLCGWKCVWTFALISEFSVIIFFICEPVYVLPSVCVRACECVCACSLWCVLQ